jgi:hypothetical protein
MIARAVHIEVRILKKYNVRVLPMQARTIKYNFERLCYFDYSAIIGDRSCRENATR